MASLAIPGLVNTSALAAFHPHHQHHHQHESEVNAGDEHEHDHESHEGEGDDADVDIDSGERGERREGGRWCGGQGQVQSVTFQLYIGRRVTCAAT